MEGKRGLFITFEGGDGAGKTTQIEALLAHVESFGREVLTTFEPGGTQLGGEIRRLLLHGGDVSPKAEALLYAADRAHHVDTVVRPALAAGKIVLSDRYIDSSLAYQAGGRDLSQEDILGLSRWASGNLVPDLTIVLDIDPCIGLKRAAKETEAQGETDRLEDESLEFHRAVRQTFLDLAKASPERYLVIDATQDREEISKQIRARIEPLL